MAVWHYRSDPACHNLLWAIPIHICFVKSSKALIKGKDKTAAEHVCE
jgi:hypothetical protein